MSVVVSSAVSVLDRADQRQAMIESHSIVLRSQGVILACGWRNLLTNPSTLIPINTGELLATNGHAFPMRSFAWLGEPILDVCEVDAEYGHLLVLVAGGELRGIDVDTGASVRLCLVELPVIKIDHDKQYFSAPCHRLHASSDGRFAAIVVDYGRHGTVVEVLTGTLTMRLDGGDYHQGTVPFSACFLCHEGRTVFVHRTAWNRLDVADPATGLSLTDRYVAPYENSSERPAHYLDYFHGQLRPSPDGSRIFDDGWVWQPVSIPRTWSMRNWLVSNPWESEDGASLVDLTNRDDWTSPACWTSEQHIALWGLAEWDTEEFEEIGQGAGVRILDATSGLHAPDSRWPMDLQTGKVLDMFSDGVCLLVATDTGTSMWDIGSRAQITFLPDFLARRHDRIRNSLLSFGQDWVSELSLHC